MLPLEQVVHTCTKCHTENKSVRYYPVYSFGSPDLKPVCVVGINPSSAEYEGKDGAGPYLSVSTDIEERRRKQLEYFGNPVYDFFLQIREFFDGEVKERVVRWKEKPWEKVSYFDLVKCVTKAAGGQWNKVPSREQKMIVMNCQDYLKQQLILHKPRLIVAYGKDVCKWFGSYTDRVPVPHGSAEATIQTLTGTYQAAISFVYQKQGPFSSDQISKVRRSIIAAFSLLNCARF